MMHEQNKFRKVGYGCGLLHLDPLLRVDHTLTHIVPCRPTIEDGLHMNTKYSI